MASFNLKNKSKTDLVELVRMSGVMPISRAQRMKKSELIAYLESRQGAGLLGLSPDSGPDLSADEEAEAIQRSAPGRLAALAQSEVRNIPRENTGERRSVMFPQEQETAEERKPVRRSIMAPPELFETPAEHEPDNSGSQPSGQSSEAVSMETGLQPGTAAPTAQKSTRDGAVTRRRGRPAAASRSGQSRAAAPADEPAPQSEPAGPTVALSGQTNKVQAKVVKKISRRELTEAVPSREAAETADSTDSGEADTAEPSTLSGDALSERPEDIRTNEASPQKKTSRNGRKSAGRKSARSRAAGDKPTDESADTETAVPHTDTARDKRSVQAKSDSESGKSSDQNQKSDDARQAHAQPTAVKTKRQNLRHKGGKLHGRGAESRDQSEQETSGDRASDQKEEASSQGGMSGSKQERQQFDSGEIVSGVMEIMPDGYGFLRRDNYLPGPKDIYIPPQFIRRFNLRQGDYISGPARVQRDSDRYQALYFIKTVNGAPPEQATHRPHFDRLVPIYPDERFTLETAKNELSTRIIDLIAPIGKGQRGMIVSPPKAGKTILLQKIANAIAQNQPDAKLIVLLIDERPEEVTDMQRSIQGEVVYSTFDKTPENHVKITELVLERAERLVEMGQDVVILLDSLTRMSRAYNLTINPTGRTLSGGLDPGALYGPKRFFGAARNIENGGSLTIIATALVETGSRMDEVIFEEFKGTGNMEVYLDRKLSEKRIFPAIDINRSGTRREELLLTSQELESVWAIRKAFGQLDSSNVTETIINLMMKTNDNRHFVSSINVSMNNRSLFETMKMGPKPGPQSHKGV